jgi:hypothetical protein
MESTANAGNGPAMESDQSSAETQLAVSAPGYDQWYAWAQREIGGDSKRLEAAANAALAALNQGMTADAAAQAARIRTTRTLVDYDHGRLGLDTGDFVVIGADGLETWRFPLDQVQAIQLSPGAGDFASLAILIKREESWRQFFNCRPMAAVDQLVRSVSLAAPAIDCRWATLSMPERHAVLDRHLNELMRSGYKVLYQSDSTAQVARDKRTSKATIVILLFVSIFAFFIPIIVYLIFYSSRPPEISMITVDEWGRLSQQVTQK